MSFTDYIVASFLVVAILIGLIGPAMQLNTENGIIELGCYTNKENIVSAFSHVEGDFVKIQVIGYWNLDIETIAALDDMGWEMVTKDVFRRKADDSGFNS